MTSQILMSTSFLSFHDKLGSCSIGVIISVDDLNSIKYINTWKLPFLNVVLPNFLADIDYKLDMR